VVAAVAAVTETTAVAAVALAMRGQLRALAMATSPTGSAVAHNRKGPRVPTAMSTYASCSQHHPATGSAEAGAEDIV